MADPKRVRAGRRSKRKGKEFEREIVAKLRAVGGTAERGYWQSRGGDETPDVVVDGFWVEASSGADVSPTEKLYQAIAQGQEWADEHEVSPPLPVAVTRKKGARTIVATMRLKDLWHVIETNLPGGNFFPVSFDFDFFMEIIRAKAKRST